MADEILKQTPCEMKWQITAQSLTGGLASLDPILGEILGVDQWKEINVQLAAEGGKMLLPMIRENFNIPVEDATGAATLAKVTGILYMGPEFTTEIVKATPERAVVRTTKCGVWEMVKELELDPELIVCDVGHQTVVEAGFKRVNPKITHKLTKAMPRGDPYCEDVFEFKEK